MGAKMKPFKYVIATCWSGLNHKVILDSKLDQFSKFFLLCSLGVGVENEGISSRSHCISEHPGLSERTNGMNSKKIHSFSSVTEVQ